MTINKLVRLYRSSIIVFGEDHELKRIYLESVLSLGFSEHEFHKEVMRLTGGIEL